MTNAFTIRSRSIGDNIIKRRLRTVHLQCNILFAAVLLNLSGGIFSEEIGIDTWFETSEIHAASRDSKLQKKICATSVDQWHLCNVVTDVQHSVCAAASTADAAISF